MLGRPRALLSLASALVVGACSTPTPAATSMSTSESEVSTSTTTDEPETETQTEAETGEPESLPCQNAELSVSGALQTSNGLLEFDSVEIELHHRQSPPDEARAGCINYVAIRFRNAETCTLEVLARGTINERELGVEFIRLNYTGDCTNYKSGESGVYTSEMIGNFYGAYGVIELSSATSPMPNEPLACLDGPLIADLYNGLAHEDNDLNGKALFINDGELVIDGELLTTALDEACPLTLCSGPGDCEEGEDCVEGVCVDPVANCGNGIIDPGEVCDGDDFGGVSCLSLGYYAGAELICVDCTSIDTSMCVGDGQPESGLYAPCASDADCETGDSCLEAVSYCTRSCTTDVECEAQFSGMATPLCDSVLDNCVIDCNGFVTCPPNMFCAEIIQPQLWCVGAAP